LLSPIPGSDYLPTLSAGYFQVTGGAMLVAASAALQLDTTNTVIYVRFLVPDGPTIYATKPLAGVPVELMDQDAPAPAGDDATTAVPADTAEKLGHSNTASETKYHFEPPTSDQTLAQGQTDLDGIVRFALLANNDTNQLATTAGEVVGVTTLTNLTTGKTISTSTSRTGEPEAKPDLYFRVTMPDGSVVDTRNLPGGFMLNFTSSRLGTLANPLTFGLGGAIVGPVAADPI
ncbi:MAG TPA: hypothetical protein VN867_07180, partial [Candidatus Binataceae bacterium]|nr:hypothetical protein [Candidatus Binataceae bacterium]